MLEKVSQTCLSLYRADGWIMHIQTLKINPPQLQTQLLLSPLSAATPSNTLQLLSALSVTGRAEEGP